jgi:hypothetical protein
MLCRIHVPDSIEFNEVRFDRNTWEGRGEKFSRAQQFATVMFRFGIAVSLEIRQPSVGGAIGVAHHEHSFRLVQANRHADLFKNEILFEIVARRGKCLRSSGDNDHVWTLDSLLLQKLPHSGADAVIEAAEHSGIGYVLALGRVVFEDFSHRAITLLILTSEVAHCYWVIAIGSSP